MVELEKIASERDLEKVKLVYSRGIFGGIRRKSLSFETYPENLELTDPDKRLFTPSEKGKYHKEIGSSIGWFGFEGIEDVENKRYIFYKRFSETITLIYSPGSDEKRKQEKGIVGQFKSIETRPESLKERLTLNDKRELNSREPQIKISLGPFEMKKDFSPDNDSIEYVKIEDLKEEKDFTEPEYKEKGNLESNLTEKIIEKKEEENKDAPKQNYEKKDNLEDNQTIGENKNNIKPNYEKTSEVESEKETIEPNYEKTSEVENESMVEPEEKTIKKDVETIIMVYSTGSDLKEEKEEEKFMFMKKEPEDLESSVLDGILLRKKGRSAKLSGGIFGLKGDTYHKKARYMIYQKIADLEN